MLVVNPLDRIGAFAEEHLRGLPFEYVEVSDTVLHRALTSQMGLKPGTPLYNQFKIVALDTYGVESPRSVIDPDAIAVDEPANGQSAPKVRVSLVYGPSITLFHDLLAERLASKDALAVKLWGTSKPNRRDLNKERKAIWDLRGWFTESQQDDWTEHRLWAARERGSRSSADPILAWANDLGVWYSNESRVQAWRYFPSLEFTWE